MAVEPTGTNPDFKTKMPALIDDADIQTALKVFLYGDDYAANSTAGTGTLVETDGSHGLVGHLNSMRTALTNAAVLKSFYAGSPGKGILLASTAANSPAAVTVGADGTVLMASSSAASGIAWNSPTSEPLSLLPKSAGASHPLTGNLNISFVSPKMVVNDTSSTGTTLVEFQDASAKKWEVGKDASNNFVVNNSAGTAVLTVTEATDKVSVSQQPVSANDVATKTYVDKSMPVGSIVAFGSATPPTGWLVCNGQSTSGYASLAAVVGANVPDLRSRFIKGVGENAQGATGGTKTIELPAHAHSAGHNISASSWVNSNPYTNNVSINHAHTIYAGFPLYRIPKWTSGEYFEHYWYLLDYSSPNPTTNSDPVHGHPQNSPGISTSISGGVTVYNNGTNGASMEPVFYALTYIIKAV